MRISDWSSDVCSSDLRAADARLRAEARFDDVRALAKILLFDAYDAIDAVPGTTDAKLLLANSGKTYLAKLAADDAAPIDVRLEVRSEEHTSELQSLMRTSYAVFCLTNTNYDTVSAS